MQALFQYDQNPGTTADFIRAYVTEELKFPELEAFSLALIDGARQHQAGIDELLKKAASNWKLERMAPVDRALLRLGVYEMAFAPDPTPPRVVISECVEIAKRFSSNDAPRFVNGVLDAATRLKEKETGDNGTSNSKVNESSDEEATPPEE